MLKIANKKTKILFLAILALSILFTACSGEKSAKDNTQLSALSIIGTVSGAEDAENADENEKDRTTDLDTSLETSKQKADSETSAQTDTEAQADEDEKPEPSPDAENAEKQGEDDEPQAQQEEKAEENVFDASLAGVFYAVSEDRYKKERAPYLEIYEDGSFDFCLNTGDFRDLGTLSGIIEIKQNKVNALIVERHIEKFAGEHVEELVFEIIDENYLKYKSDAIGLTLKDNVFTRDGEPAYVQPEPTPTPSPTPEPTPEPEPEPEPQEQGLAELGKKGY